VVRRGRGGLVIDPFAIVHHNQVVVPDLAPTTATLSAARAPAHADDAIGTALEQALHLLAEVAHRGGRHLPPTYPDRLRASASTLATTGLTRCGQALHTLAEACGSDEPMVTAWVDAQIRLMVAADNR
jgi:hypothetical protein